MPADIAGTGGMVLDLGAAPHQLQHELRNRQHADLLAAGDVHTAANQLVAFRGEHDAAHRVLDPSEVTGLQPVAENGERAPGHGLGDEPWDDLAARACHVLARPVHVERADHGNGQPVGAVEAQRVCLAGELAGRVWSGRFEWMLLVHRHAHRGAVNLG